MIGKQGYPSLSGAHAAALMGWIETLVSDPQRANFGRRYAGNDLEIEIAVAASDRHLITPEACVALQTRLAALTGITSPVVYLSGAPHEAAEEAIKRARSGD